MASGDNTVEALLGFIGDLGFLSFRAQGLGVPEVRLKAFRGSGFRVFRGLLF